jgi:predicted ATP-binding protein involved in virulence
MSKERLQIESVSTNGKEERLSLPAYFLSLEVENVRSFGPKQTLDLSNGNGRPAQWTIILGDNGVGKTTLLQCITALLPFPDFIDFHKGRGEEQYATPSGLHIPIIESNWKPYRHESEPINIAARFFVRARLTHGNQGIETGKFILKKYKYGYSSVVAGKYASIGEINCFGYGASRRMGETSFSERADGEPFESLFSDDVALLNAEEWLLQADYTAHAAKSEAARKRAEKRRDEIKEVLINLLPDVEDIRFAQLTEKQQKPGVEVKTPYGWVSIKDLSLGYKTLVAWMVDFASRMFDRYPESRNPLAEPAVVLVDEIDLHLHPKWQRTLMGYLSERFPNTQFIATAHSPLVVQAASDANIVLLKRVGDHVIVENDVKAIHGWRVDQILTSDLFGLESARPPQLDALLEERTKLLSKSRLTKKDRARLAELEEEIGALPTGETTEDMEAMDIIRRAAQRLKKEGRETSHDSGD